MNHCKNLLLLLFTSLIAIGFASVAFSKSNKSTSAFGGVYMEQPRVDVNQLNSNEPHSSFARSISPQEGLSLSGSGYAVRLGRSLIKRSDELETARDYSLALSERYWGLNLRHWRYQGFAQGTHEPKLSSSINFTKQPASYPYDLVASKTAAQVQFAPNGKNYSIEDIHHYFPSNRRFAWTPVLGLTLLQQSFGTTTASIPSNGQGNGESITSNGAILDLGLAAGCYWEHFYGSFFATFGRGILQNSGATAMATRNESPSPGGGGSQYSAGLKWGYRNDDVASGLYLDIDGAEIKMQQDTVRMINQTFGAYAGFFF